MTIVRHRGGGVIVVTVIIALMLAILPLPLWAEPYRPAWPVLVLIYWCMALPQRVGVGVGWIIGLLVDVLKGSLLGQHALAMAVVAYITLNVHQRVRVFPLWQQAFAVLLLLLLYQLLSLWFDGITGGETAKGWSYWIPSLSGMFLWPWVFIILRDMRRRFRVS